jgi:hypothetical protein
MPGREIPGTLYVRLINMSNDTQVSSIDDTPANSAAAPKVAGAKRQPKVDGHDVALSGKKKTITIHVSDAENGQDAVPIGLNGYMYLVPRGVPVEVPEEIVGILENAKTSTFHPSKDGDLVERVHNRFAFSVH